MNTIALEYFESLEWCAMSSSVYQVIALSCLLYYFSFLYNPAQSSENAVYSEIFFIKWDIIRSMAEEKKIYLSK